MSAILGVTWIWRMPKVLLLEVVNGVLRNQYPLGATLSKLSILLEGGVMNTPLGGCVLTHFEVTCVTHRWKGLGSSN